MDQRQINELMARVAKLETLLEANDAYQPPGAVTLKDMDLGPGLSFDIPDYSQWQNQNLEWDPEYDPQSYSDWQNELQQANDAFATTQGAVDDILSRLGNIETFLSGGSNDTNQSGALNAGAGVGDDGQTGTGDAATSTDDMAESLGLGTMAYQDGSAVAITGGSVTGTTATGLLSLSVTDGTNSLFAVDATNPYGRLRIREGADIIIEMRGVTGDGALISLFDDAGANENRLAVNAAGGLDITGAGVGMTFQDTFSVIIHSSGYVQIGASTTDNVGFFGSTGAAKATVSGSRGGNAALASLLTQLAAYGLITDGSSP